MTTTPGFRSIFAWASPQRGWGILSFPDLEQFSQTFVPRIRYTWYALVFKGAVLPVATLISEMSPFGALRSIAGAEG